MPTTYAIPDGRTVFNISLSNTGTTSGPGAGVAKVISGLAFQPDMVWSKNRSSSSNARWGLIDSVRGVNNTLSQSNTFAEVTSQTDLLTSFNSNGVNIGADAAGYGWNWNQQSGASDNYAYWLWKAGGTAVTNNDGSVASQVSANTTAGFSVVTFTAPASGNFSAGHGLGVTPGMVITKVRGRATSWITWHNRLNSGSPGTTYYVELNTTGGQSTFANVWGSTGVTSSVIGMGVGATCAASDTIVAYCFSAVAGYSAFGSYTGNGSADGPFIYTGFRPRFVMIKKSSGTDDWCIQDTARDPYNMCAYKLGPNSSGAENYAALGNTTENNIDILSNGFKLRSINSLTNASGATLIYACFAENPFKFANAR